jgi:light-regulated signal transduction histidine kinase (bacteriophytochrome)
LNLARALQRSNEDLEQFAYAASHDLQEPLRKILGFGERLEEECGGLLTPDGQDYLRRMLSAGHRMRALIQDLLSYSRLSTRLQTLFPVNLTTIAKQVIGDLELRIEQLRATIELKELPTVHADPVEMRQLLQNLISNALKFRKEGRAPVGSQSMPNPWGPPGRSACRTTGLASMKSTWHACSRSSSDCIAAGRVRGQWHRTGHLQEGRRTPWWKHLWPQHAW